MIEFVIGIFMLVIAYFVASSISVIMFKQSNKTNKDILDLIKDLINYIEKLEKRIEKLEKD